MTEILAPSGHDTPSGHLADNVAGFADLLRRSGMKLGLETTSLAAQALATIDMRDRRQANAAQSAAMERTHRARAPPDAARA